MSPRRRPCRGFRFPPGQGRPRPARPGPSPAPRFCGAVRKCYTITSHARDHHLSEKARPCPASPVSNQTRSANASLRPVRSTPVAVPWRGNAARSCGRGGVSSARQLALAGETRCLRHGGPAVARRFRERQLRGFENGSVSAEEWARAEVKARNALTDAWRKNPARPGATIDLGPDEGAFVAACAARGWTRARSTRRWRTGCAGAGRGTRRTGPMRGCGARRSKRGCPGAAARGGNRDGLAEHRYHRPPHAAGRTGRQGGDACGGLGRG